MSIEVRSMTAADCAAVLELWRASEGMGLGASDTNEQIVAYLARNPGLSLVALNDGRIVGAVLCGHDGRRGFLHHLAVAGAFRRQGIGRSLVERAIDGLRGPGILRSHIFVYGNNVAAAAFWERLGWSARDHLRIMSRDI